MGFSTTGGTGTFTSDSGLNSLRIASGGVTAGCGVGSGRTTRISMTAGDAFGGERGFMTGVTIQIDNASRTSPPVMPPAMLRLLRNASAP